MRKFIGLTLAFVVAVGASLWLLEVALRHIPNRYRAKAQYMEQHAEQIETLVFGSSHAFMGIDAAIFGPTAYNLANVSQSLDYDRLLLEKYLPRCKNLQRVLVSVSPFSLYSVLGQSDPALLGVYDAEFGLRTTPIGWKYRFEVLFNAKAADKLIDYYLKGRDMVCMTEQGLSTMYSLANKKAEGWDNGIERARSHTYGGPPMASVVGDLGAMARLCHERGIDFVVITTPFMPSYVAHIDPKQWGQTVRVIDSLSVAYSSLRVLNYFGDTSYSHTPDYFFDADHLTPQGAAVFSAALTDSISL